MMFAVFAAFVLGDSGKLQKAERPVATETAAMLNQPDRRTVHTRRPEHNNDRHRVSGTADRGNSPKTV